MTEIATGLSDGCKEAVSELYLSFCTSSERAMGTVERTEL